MPAAVHFSFLSFDDALISVSRAADDRFAVGLSAILAILDDVALVVDYVYSKGFIHSHNSSCSFQFFSVLATLERNYGNLRTRFLVGLK